MGKKLSYEEVKKEIENANYILISNYYIDIHSKLTIKDTEGYIFLCSLNNFRKRRPRKFDVSNSYTIQNIKLYCQLNNKPFKLISNKYEGATKKLKWKCLNVDCGEEFEALLSSIYSGHGCGICNGMQVGLSNCLATKYPELAKEWHPTKNVNLTPFDVTFGSGKRVWWQCSKNPKHEWQIAVNNRSLNNRGCPYCAGNLPTDEYNLLVCNPKLCEEWDYSKNKKKPEEYCPSSSKKVWWICKDCGHNWHTSPNSRNSYSGSSCPKCNKPKGEKKISNKLDMMTINFIPQKEFDGLLGVGGGNLSYDFYLPDYNLLIEYQGEYHDGTAGNQTKKDFKIQKEHDKRKREYAKNNKINLLEIWYWDFDNIEQILENELMMRMAI